MPVADRTCLACHDLTAINLASTHLACRDHPRRALPRPAVPSLPRHTMTDRAPTRRTCQTSSRRSQTDHVASRLPDQNGSCAVLTSRACHTMTDRAVPFEPSPDQSGLPRFVFRRGSLWHDPGTGRACLALTGRSKTNRDCRELPCQNQTCLARPAVTDLAEHRPDPRCLRRRDTTILNRANLACQAAHDKPSRGQS